MPFVVAEIDHSGDVLNRELFLTAYDTQSSMHNYAQRLTAEWLSEAFQA